MVSDKKSAGWFRDKTLKDESFLFSFLHPACLVSAYREATGARNFTVIFSVDLNENGFPGLTVGKVGGTTVCN